MICFVMLDDFNFLMIMDAFVELSRIISLLFSILCLFYVSVIQYTGCSRMKNEVLNKNNC